MMEYTSSCLHTSLRFSRSKESHNSTGSSTKGVSNLEALKPQISALSVVNQAY